ncbi:hypothetical protein EUZ85_13890 [Hahella sp. KA22]|uniref:Phenylacetic acid catabolic protein n=1 Tax=Hahella sp. KA22 TaxID=1628392 RepID=UPI000FDE747A|nr:Phenylacetic acid catabolic protein [Hahella sp. KA22]AZZ91762.1 hypothetical protein ENC22_11330 [Hahella sp. KA22]QAY55132.1 hypothetical protein EUZ85_13890 [Hahella sp. KA22]
MAAINEYTIDKKYHDALIEWQRKNFPDIGLLEKYWDVYFPNDPAWRLTAKLSEVKVDVINQGKYQGVKKYATAREMKGSMLYQALRIIKAQCSTELGSIQQHMDTVNTCYTDKAKFSVLRIMAEEFRHAYQMFWVLSHDPSWSTTGSSRIAENTLDELLSMNTGSHVLDAFNIPFTDSLDNVTFACFIDRVGRFQLTMQEEFAYAPMAASMRPMLKEEAFHLKTGWEVLKEICEMAAVGEGPWTLADIQKKINLWYPRALEMFGSEEGGESNLEFSFKTMSNKEAIGGYIKEIEWLLNSLNAAILQRRHPELSKEQVRLMAKETAILRLPSTRFLRFRSGEAIHESTFDVDGNRISPFEYINYLTRVLPEKLCSTEYFRSYTDRIRQALPTMTAA